MLEPDDRQHLFQALAPPAGYRLDTGIGTTFSLDLLALLTVPLGVTFSEWEGGAGDEGADPIAMLQAIRRSADRLAVFCQVGRIYVPPRISLLVGYLEDCVVEVRPGDGQGVFHPKIWILRFVTEDGPALYRVLCSSRNLTFDASWDTLLVLEGELQDRRNAIAANHPLGDFVAALPRLAVHPVSKRVEEMVGRVEGELRRVKFGLPEGFEEISFLPLGIANYTHWPFKELADQALIVSPFVHPGFLKRIQRSAREVTLVSRLETLQGLPQDELQQLAGTFFLDPSADPELAEEEDATGSEWGGRLTGLHAKLVVEDYGWDARVWTGSANATMAAFEHNIEFLVQLRGKRSKSGVDALMAQEKGKLSFRDLLGSYVPGEIAMVDGEVSRLENILDSVQVWLGGVGLRAEAVSSVDSAIWTLQLSAEGPAIAPEGTVSISCWPILIPHTSAVAMNFQLGHVAEFSRLAVDSLTEFLAFEAKAALGERIGTRRFVLRVPLHGAPSDRFQRILVSLLQDPEGFLRLLLLLLSTSDDPPTQMASLLAGGASAADFALRRGSMALFEPLLRALSRNPSSLDEISSLVADLRGSPDTTRLLPEGFDQVWIPIWQARQRLTK